MGAGCTILYWESYKRCFILAKKVRVSIIKDMKELFDLNEENFKFYEIICVSDIRDIRDT